MKLCSKCGVNPQHRNSWCIACRAAYNRHWQQQHRHPRQPNNACSKCRVNPRRKGGRYCLDCQAAYNRTWFKTHPHPFTPNQIKHRATRTQSQNYVKAGKIQKQPCQYCGATKAEMHHPDYSKPLEVIWLCHPCHLMLHAKQQARTTHCKNGHELTPENTNSRNGCRICKREKQRAKRQQQRTTIS